MRVYDCFLFFNEFDLLELRLKTLDHYVDHFVLVEAPWTFTGHPKPLYFKENYERFQPWIRKIRHIALQGDLETDNPWHREYASRNAMEAGIEDAEADDLIFQSDCDEIWRPEKRDEGLDQAPIMVLGQDIFYYYLNTRRVPRIVWPGPRRLRRRHWKPGWGQTIRQINTPILDDGGWHFSFLGDAEHARKKMLAFSHTEYSGDEYTNLEAIKTRMLACEDLMDREATYLPVDIDESFPAPLLEEPDRWARHILAET